MSDRKFFGPEGRGDVVAGAFVHHRPYAGADDGQCENGEKAESNRRLGAGFGAHEDEMLPARSALSGIRSAMISTS